MHNKTDKNTEYSPDETITRTNTLNGLVSLYRNNNKHTQAVSAEVKLCNWLSQSVPKYLWPKCVGATA